MNYKQSLDNFIIYLARKIAISYPSNYADEDDYIQEGYLKLIEIYNSKQNKHDFQAYAIISIARAMRRAATMAMYNISAPHRIKKLIRKIEILLNAGKTEQAICKELIITPNTLTSLKLLIKTEPLHELFEEPTLDLESFSILDDLLLSSNLTEEDRIFIQEQFGDTIENLGLSKKQRWMKAKNIRNKLIRSNYK